MPHSLILISLLIIGCGAKDDTPDAEWGDDEAADGWGGSADGGSSGGGTGDTDGGETGGDDGEPGDDGDDGDDGGDADGIGDDGDPDGGTSSWDLNIEILSPETGTEFSDPWIELSFEVSGCNVNSPSADPDGCHLHRTINGMAYEGPDGDGGHGHYSADPMSLYLGEPGGKNIRLELHRNDGTDLPYEPSVSDTVTVIYWEPEDTGAADDGGGDDGGDDGSAPAEECPDGAPDAYEPNDTEPTDFGDRDGSEFETSGAYLYPSTDTDIYRFYVVDGGWDWFSVSATVTDVPETVDLAVSLLFVEDSDGESHGEVDSSDDLGLGGDEEVSIDESWFIADKTGWYEVVVTSTDGSSCSQPYTLTINADTR